jgi:pimeloyl-ACP methyl ester carboxylesterase
MKIASVLKLVLVIPLVIIAYLIFLLIWIFLTITGIGPVIQYFCSRRDRKQYLDRDVLQATTKDLCFISSRGNQLAVRFTTPTVDICSLKHYPVCIPNGMAATMTMIGKLHDGLVKQGFTVLTYDRFGTGFSDENLTAKSPTVEETVEDMERVMSTFMPVDQKWILLGPSMGSIVGQCYTAVFPHKVVGFLNMDGLPYPFHTKRKLFTFYGSIYWIESMLVWTGLFRFFLCFATKAFSKVSGDTFSTSVLLAQANQRAFYRNVWLEMTLMMDCCTAADTAWGRYSVCRLGPDAVQALIRAPPTRCGDQDADGAWREDASESSASDAATAAAAAAAVAAEADCRDAPLAAAWRDMTVRVMSARNYDFPLSSRFYDDEMRNHAAAEHAQHALWARDGGRDVFPRRTHMDMIFAEDTILDNASRIAAALEARPLLGDPATLAAATRASERNAAAAAGGLAGCGASARSSESVASSTAAEVRDAPRADPSEVPAQAYEEAYEGRAAQAYESAAAGGGSAAGSVRQPPTYPV